VLSLGLTGLTRLKRASRTRSLGHKIPSFFDPRLNASFEREMALQEATITRPFAYPLVDNDEAPVRPTYPRRNDTVEALRGVAAVIMFTFRSRPTLHPKPDARSLAHTPRLQLEDISFLDDERPRTRHF